MDSTLLNQVVNNPDLLRQAMEEFQRNLAEVGGKPEAPVPTIDVPVRVVDPPVTLHGKLDLQVTFDAEVLSGMSYDAIVQRTLDVLGGGGDAWSPKVVVGNLRLERREIRERGSGVSGVGFGPGSPGAGPSGPGPATTPDDDAL